MKNKLSVLLVLLAASPAAAVDDYDLGVAISGFTGPLQPRSIHSLPTDTQGFLDRVPGANLIDFSLGTNGVAVNGPYGETGVSFSGHNGGQATASTFAPNSAPLSVISGGGVGAGGGGFAVELPADVNAFGIHVGGPQFAGNIIQFFNESGQLIREIDVVAETSSNAGGYNFIGLIDDDPIARVTITTAGNDYVWYDDIYYGTTSVPEPTSAALLALAGTALLRRRRD